MAARAPEALDIPSPPEGYTLGVQLGSGGCATVYAATRDKDNAPVAIKFIPKKHLRKKCIKKGGKKLPLEVHLMKKVAHVQGCIELIDYCVKDGCLIIIMERPEYSMQLYQYLNRQEGCKLSETEARDLFGHLVKTISEVHRAGVLHGDVKEENLLVDLQTGKLKLIDFGGGHLFTSDVYHDFVGTQAFAPPEVFINKSFHAVPLTVWSLGTILHTMVCGREPYKTKKDIAKQKLMSYAFTRLPHCLKQLIERMLSINPAERPSLYDIRHHPWMQGEVARRSGLTHFR